MTGRPVPAATGAEGNLFLKALIFPALLVALWAGLDGLGWTNDRLFASPADVIVTLAEDTASGALPGAALASLARALGGWAIGAAAGLVFGVAVGTSGLLRAVFDPTVVGLRQIALFAWIPLLSAWLGNGESMKITLIALGAFFPMALAAQAACQTIPQGWREVGLVLDLTRAEQLRTIVLPAALPGILAGVELSLNVAWLGTFGAEYLIGTGYINGAGDGIGAYLSAAREYLRMDRVLLGVLVLGLIGVSLDRLIVHISRKVAPWQRP